MPLPAPRTKTLIQGLSIIISINVSLKIRRPYFCRVRNVAFFRCFFPPQIGGTVVAFPNNGNPPRAPAFSSILQVTGLDIQDLQHHAIGHWVVQQRRSWNGRGWFNPSLKRGKGVDFQKHFRYTGWWLNQPI